MPRLEPAAPYVLPALPLQSRILVIRLRSIGDTILLTPALRLLKQWRPDLRVSVLLDSRFSELLGSNPDVEEVIGFDPRSKRGGFIGKLHLIRQLRTRRFALCLNLHGGSTSAFLTVASGARFRAGFWHFRYARFYNLSIPDARVILNQPSIHTAEHQASALFWLGLPRAPIPPARLEIKQSDLVWWRSEKQRLGIPEGSPYAVLHPAALYATKQWSESNFAALGADLESAVGLPVIYTAGPGESAVLDRVSAASRSSIRRLETPSLGRFAAALSQARLFVGNDSGPAHMAAALAIPQVVIFGSSSSSIWHPWQGNGGSLVSRVVQNEFECNPCRGDRCYHFNRPECILSVTLDQVKSAVEVVLKEQSALSTQVPAKQGGNLDRSSGC